ncbi:MAG: hypothetical protein ACP5JH_05635 [Bacteroidota bacterium]
MSKLEKFNEMEFSDTVSQQLLTVSGATIDGLLKEEKKKVNKAGHTSEKSDSCPYIR